MPKIEFADVSVAFRGKRKTTVDALKHIDLSLDSGLIHAFLGESGSGKTTLLKCLYDGVPFEGKILLDGADIETIPVQKRKMSLLSQNYALYPHLTNFENIAFPLKVMGAGVEEIKSRVYAIAEELGITACLSRKPRQVSGGQKQRVALARALIKEPELCLLDEPFSNLDAASASAAMDLLYRSLKKRGITALLVTHEVREATALADTVHILKEGEIVFNGTNAEFIEREMG